MSCPGINDILVRESGRVLPGQIFRRIFGASPWPTLTDRGIFPGGLGQIINLLHYERNAPYVATPEWLPIVINDGQEGGACLQPAENIEIGSTMRNMQLYRRILHGPPFCAEETRFPFEVGAQLDQITGIIGDRVDIEWQMRDRNEYSRLVGTKVVVDSATNPTTDDDASGDDYPQVCPTQTLGLGMLENFKLKLLRNGAANSALLRADGAPVLTVIGSPEFIGNLKRANASLREDIRWATATQGMNAALLQGFGVSYTLQGFMFLADLYNNRYNCVNGVPVKIPTFLREAAGKGFKAEVNPDWETAEIEEILIYDRTVYKQLVPEPITAPAPGFRFNPVSYVGAVKWLNIPSVDCNPDSNIGFHRIVMAAASQPINTWRGVGFLVKRCAVPSGNATTCSS